MARTQVTVGTLSRSGSDLSTVSADTVNGNYFAWTSGPVLLSFFAVAPCTITARSPMYVDTVLKVPDLAISLTPGTVKLWSLTDPAPFLDGNNVNFDASAACSVAIYKV